MNKIVEKDSPPKYFCVIKVEQHSPLIHFQSNQKGAGLRASELKPKLDRYLLKKLKNKLTPYLKSNQKYALDYSVKIRYRVYKSEIMEKNKDGKIKSECCLICNMGKELTSKKIYKAILLNNIEIEIKSPFKKLLEIIDQNINVFFIENSFGNRTSKGYGCFYRKEVDYNDLFLNRNYKLLFEKNLDKTKEIDIKEYRDIFKDIESKWIEIKRGKRGRTSLINLFAESKGYFSLKRKLRNSRDKNHKKYKNYKDLLGLSMKEKWGNKDLVKEVNGKLKEEKYFKIERFKSPIQIKVYYNNGVIKVYYTLNKIDEKNRIWGAECSVKLGGVEEKGVEEKIDMPEKFNLNDLLDYIDSNLN